jgi:hypothetical protein
VSNEVHAPRNLDTVTGYQPLTGYMFNLIGFNPCNEWHRPRIPRGFFGRILAKP